MKMNLLKLLCGIALLSPLYSFAACPALINAPVMNSLTADASVPIGSVLATQNVTIPGSRANCPEYGTGSSQNIFYANQSLRYVGNYEYELTPGINIKIYISRSSFQSAYAPQYGCFGNGGCGGWSNSSQTWYGGNAVITYIKRGNVPANVTVPAGKELYTLGVGNYTYPQIRFVTANATTITPAIKCNVSAPTSVTLAPWSGKGDSPQSSVNVSVNCPSSVRYALQASSPTKNAQDGVMNADGTSTSTGVGFQAIYNNANVSWVKPFVTDQNTAAIYPVEFKYALTGGNVNPGKVNAAFQIDITYP